MWSSEVRLEPFGGPTRLKSLARQPDESVDFVLCYEGLPILGRNLNLPKPQKPAAQAMKTIWSSAGKEASKRSKIQHRLWVSDIVEYHCLLRRQGRSTSTAYVHLTPANPDAAESRTVPRCAIKRLRIDGRPWPTDSAIRAFTLTCERMRALT